MSLKRSAILRACALTALLPALAHAQTTLPDTTGGLPWVDQVVIGPKPDELPVIRPICPDDSIQVRLLGHFPNGCYRVAGVLLLPSPIAGPFPAPPIVRLQIAHDECEGVCTQNAPPFEASVILPPLLAGSNFLLVEVEDLGCPMTTPGTIYRASFPFVVERCDPMGACLFGGWKHESSRLCDARIGPGGTADVTFTVQSTVPLAGLEGTFHVYGVFPNERTSFPPLAITAMKAVGPAEGMRLAWSRTVDGARFALFAEHGAPIPGSESFEPHPVLQLTLEAVRDRLPETMFVYADRLLGADEAGQGVPLCNIRTFAAVQAVICTDLSGCDFNRDGRLDIRDLVMMVRCIGAPEDGPGVTCDAQFHDCNGDGVKDLADVICCAREMLRIGCIDCAPTPGAGPVRAMLAEPRIEDDEVTVSLALDGWENFAGAIVRIAWPGDRYDLSYDTFDVPGMLDLTEERDGEIAFGLVRLPDAGAPQPIERGDIATLRFKLKAGMAHGGAIAFSGGEFSGPDGEQVEASFDAPLVLGPTERLSLSEARPNPFTGETRFEVTLDRAADVALRVFDLAGRQVATLHTGRLGPGTSAFVWNGVGEDGRTTRSGIYFLRATTDGHETVRRLVRLD